MIKSLASTAAGVMTGTGGGGGGPAGSNHSQDGAKINYFDRAASTPSGAPGQDAGSAGGAAPAGDTGSSGGGGSNAGSAAGGHSQNPAALAATWGDTQSPLNFIGKVGAKI